MIFDSLPEPRNTISLARFATIFAVIFGVAFGLCAVSSTIGIDFSEQAATFLIQPHLSSKRSARSASSSSAPSRSSAPCVADSKTPESPHEHAPSAT